MSAAARPSGGPARAAGGLGGPAPRRLKRRLEPPASAGEREDGDDRRAGVEFAPGEARVGQLPQARARDALRDLGQRAAELAERGRALEPELDDQQRPALAEQLGRWSPALADARDAAPLFVGSRGRSGLAGGTLCSGRQHHSAHRPCPVAVVHGARELEHRGGRR